MGWGERLQRFAWRRDADTLRPVELLELHVTHVCNLTCESCSHYSNHGHHGHIAVADADAWMGLWHDRLDVRQFDLLGGEPSAHPELPAFVTLVRRQWPKALIRVLTNGFFLHRHPDLPRLMADDGNATLRLSIHHNAPDYRARLQPILDLVREWQHDFGIAVDTVDSHAQWTRRYLGFGAAMQPFADDDPRRSWEICPAKYCKQLFQGQLWKCAPLAYLQMQKAKYDLSSQWDPYLRYRPLSADCSDTELDQFLALEDEAFCGMCPAERRPFDLPIPLRSLTRPQATPAAAE